MLDAYQIRQIIAPILRKYLPEWDDFLIEFDDDNGGDPSIFILTEIKPTTSGTEVSLLDSLHEIRSELRRHGDFRLPYVRYSSAQERQEVGL